MTDNEKNLYEVINQLEKRIEILEHVTRVHDDVIENFVLDLKCAAHRVMEDLDD